MTEREYNSLRSERPDLNLPEMGRIYFSDWLIVEQSDRDTLIWRRAIALLAGTERKGRGIDYGIFADL